MSVIVTGAAGHLGRLVAAELLERLPPEELIFVTRRPDALRELRERGADIRYGDFDEPSSLPAAFAGGRRMLMIPADVSGHRVRQHRAALDAAAAAGVRQVVFTSIVNPVVSHPIGALAWELGRTESLLERSGLEWTVLRFTTFAELVIPNAATAIQNKQLVTNNGKGRVVPVSRRDCAAAAAVALTTDGHGYKTYDITGPEALSAQDLASLYEELSGRPVKLVQMSDAMLTSILLGVGTPAPAVWSITAFGRAARLGYFDVRDPAFEALTGRPAVALRDVLAGYRADLLGVG
jgi:NAD(P)H dehydrogenase (quinone)